MTIMEDSCRRHIYKTWKAYLMGRLRYKKQIMKDMQFKSYAQLKEKIRIREECRDTTNCDNQQNY